MALPKMNVATHTMKLPSNGKELTYRPFLVKEEKILMTAMESGEQADMMRALRQIINSCVQEDIQTTTLPMFDIEYIFLQLRAKSVGDKIPIQFSLDENDPCDQGHDKCNYQVEIDVNEITVVKSDNHVDVIKLTEDIAVKMKYPQIETAQQVVGKEGEELVEKTFEMIGQCIDYVIEGKEMHKSSDYSEKEINEFLNSLSSGQFKEIQKYFETMPKLRKEITAKCECGKTSTKMLEGIADFFG